MDILLSPAKDLGFQHMLEAGLHAISDAHSGEGRHDEILDALVEIFDEAGRGSKALQGQNLLFGAQQRTDFERFTLFFRYLQAAFGNELSSRLSETAAVLATLRQGKPEERTRVERAAEMLEKLLSAIRHENALAPLVPPRAFQYG